MKLEFFIIDPQNDFCKPGGALYVGDPTAVIYTEGASKDSMVLANTIKRLSKNISAIHVTLDTHHWMHIAHPSFWVDAQRNHPKPFTLIFLDDLNNGKWMTTNPAFMTRARKYVETLEANKRYVLCIWPPHCLIGTPGHNVVDPIREVLLDWEKEKESNRMVDYVTKGSNLWTEHYSAVQADVPDSTDPTTQLNRKEGSLIDLLSKADIIAISGQALSHCVANTIRDVANTFGEENIEKMVLLEDTTSPVGDLPGSTMFKDMADGFVKEMTGRGMKVSKADDFLR